MRVSDCLSLCGFVCYYQGIGEKWTNWSFMQLGGFAVLMCGTFAYKALVKLPWVSDEVYAQAENDTLMEAAENDEGRPRKMSIGYTMRVGSVDRVV
jgi:hypothetical protein